MNLVLYPLRDAMMCKAIGGTFSAWNGKDKHISVGTLSGGNRKTRGLIKFSIDFTDVTSITQAKLWLAAHRSGDTHAFASASSTFSVKRVTKDWAESSIDPGEGQFTTQIASYGWDNYYDQFTDSGAVSKFVSQQNDDDGYKISIDVTDIVNAWKNGKANYGFMLINDYESASDSNRGIEFYSGDANNKTYWPQLVIDAVSNQKPYRATNLSPSIASGSGYTSSLTPSFSATNYDPDEADYVTSAEYKVWPVSYRFTLNHDTDMSNPGSGVMKWDSAYGSLINIPTDGDTPRTTARISISKTDADGKAVFPISTLNNISIDNLVDGNHFSLSGVTSAYEASNYAIITYGNVISSYFTDPTSTDPAIPTGSTAYVFNIDSPAWNSGQLKIDNEPQQFNTIYGTYSGVSYPLLSKKLYRWRVAYADKGQLWSKESIPAYFITNAPPLKPRFELQSYPYNDIKTLNPDFYIKHIDSDAGDAGMHGYNLNTEIYNSSTNQWSAFSSTTEYYSSPYPVDDTINIPIALDWANTYRAKASTIDMYNTLGEKSDLLVFSTHKTAVPIELSPSGGQMITSTAYFTGKVGDAYDSLAAYKIHLQDTSGPYDVAEFVTSSYITSASSFNYKYTGLTNGNEYRWRASAYANIGGYSDWSDWNTFSVSNALSPYIISPYSGPYFSTTPLINFGRNTNFTSAYFEIYDEDNALYYSSDYFSTGTTSAYSQTYSGTELGWSSSYAIRAKVYDATNGWSSWTTKAPFVTAYSEGPTLISVGGVAIASDPWLTDTSPSFYIYGGDLTVTAPDYWYSEISVERNGSEIDNTGWIFQYGGSHYAYDDLITLSGGLDYQWKARYKDSNGKISKYTSSPYTFRINAAPSAPIDISPGYGGGVESMRAGKLPEFKATFVDEDGPIDSPSSWYINIYEQFVMGPSDYSWSKVHTKHIPTTSIVNSYQWLSTDYALEDGTTYLWNTSFYDSKGAHGAPSETNGFVMLPEPNATFVSPFGSSRGSASVVGVLNPVIQWDIENGPQQRYRIDVQEYDGTEDGESNGYPLLSGKIQTYTSISGITRHNFANTSGPKIENGKFYEIKLYVTNTAEYTDTSPAVLCIEVDTSAPAIIADVTANSANNLYVEIKWSKSVDTKFNNYSIYRRIVGDTDWKLTQQIDDINQESYNDWYAGSNINYQYKVTQTNKSGSESPDNANVIFSIPISEGQVHIDSVDDVTAKQVAVSTATIDSDEWIFIPYNRSPSLTQSLQVVDSSYNKVIQQESFETLGSNRKLVIRGFVLGDEGSITCIWTNEEVPSPGDPNVYYKENIIGRRFLDYISKTKGPHILKSPFGDVWEVQFEGPEISWSPVGILQASISWVETGSSGGGSL